MQRSTVAGGDMDALEQRLDAIDYAISGNGAHESVTPIYHRYCPRRHLLTFYVPQVK